MKREAPRVLYLIKHELRVITILNCLKTIHFTPILSVCLRKNFQCRCFIRRENKSKSFVTIRLSEVQRKTSAELFYNGIVGPNLGRHLLFCSQIPPHNAVRDEFGTSLSMNFGKANPHVFYQI